MALYEKNEKGEIICCEWCPVCGEYQAKNLSTGEYIHGWDCGH